MLAAKNVFSSALRKQTIRSANTVASKSRFSTLPESTPSVGSSLGQRLTAFFAGVGVASIACGYVIFDELVEANARFDKALRSLDNRVKSLEK